MKMPHPGRALAVAVVALAAAACDKSPRQMPAPRSDRNDAPISLAATDRGVAPTLVGAGGCTSAGCHAAPVEGHAAWQSAYTVWSTRDPHARAHESLRGPLAERIVAALVARDHAHPQPPAWENMACIGCHATARGPTAGEGVSCESCHGPAGNWLVAHTEKGWNTRGNTLGMINLADAFTCAATCADCHVGGGPTTDGAIREVTHDLIAAGHPRLAFELRSYKRAEPPHWHDRFMAATGSGPGPVDEWAQGRLAAVAHFLRQVESQSQAAATGDRGLTAGVWPEFTAFDCHGCHRPAALVAALRPAGIRPAAPPGSPRLDPLHFSNLDAILPPERLGPVARARAAVDRRWTAIPDAATLAAALQAIEGARPGLGALLAAASAEDLGRRITQGTDPANWAEAVAALGGLEAVVDREAAAGRLVDEAGVRSRLAAVRVLLEFPMQTVDGQTERFSSPRDYDAPAIGEHLRVIASALGPSARGLGR